MKLKYSLVIGLVVFGMTGLFVSCSSSSDSGGGSDTNFMSATITQMATVSNNFTPDSLASGSSSGFNALEASGPCVGTDLYGCQPRLLKLYMFMGKMFFDMSRQMITEIGTHMGDVPDGDQGTVTEDGVTVTYKKVSATNYDILVANSESAPMLDFSYDGSQISVKANITELSESEQTGSLETTINYTDENNWDITLFFHNSTCDSEEVDAPEKIKIKISYVDGMWKGKAMMYSPRWIGEGNNCATPVTNDTAANIYTDFVGNDVATRASVYLMSRTVADFQDAPENYALNQLCANYWQIAGFDNEAQCDTITPLELYPNPFCSQGAEDATWNNNCAGINAAVGAAEYSSNTLWSLPNAFYSETISLRTNLDD